MIRSMSDEQIEAAEIARHGVGFDKEPWVGPPDNSATKRYAEQGHPQMKRTFDPRPECIPSPDPLPFECVNFTTRYAYQELSCRCLRIASHPHVSHYRPRPWGSFTPDPEFVRSEVNPILSAFRDDQRLPVEMRVVAYLHAGEADRWIGRTEQVESAKKVLTRLRDAMEALE